MARTMNYTLRNFPDNETKSILQEPFPAVKWLNEHIGYCCGNEDFMDSDIRQRAIFIQVLHLLGDMTSYPVVGGFVRNVVIPMKNGRGGGWEDVRDLDIVVPTMEEAEVLCNKLQKLAESCNCKLDKCERQDDNVYPFPGFNLFFTPTGDNVHGACDIRVDLIVTPKYVCTDFVENDIAFYPAPDMSKQFNLRDIVLAGHLEASKEAIDNILNFKMTMKPGYAQRLKQVGDEIKSLGEHSWSNGRYLRDRLFNFFYWNVEIYGLSEDDEKIKIRNPRSRQFLVPDLNF